MASFASKISAVTLAAAAAFTPVRADMSNWGNPADSQSGQQVTVPVDNSAKAIGTGGDASAKAIGTGGNASNDVNNRMTGVVSGSNTNDLSNVSKNSVNGEVNGANTLNSATTNNNAQRLSTESGATATTGNQVLKNDTSLSGGNQKVDTSATGGAQKQDATATSQGSTGNNTNVVTNNSVKQAANAIGMPTMIAPQLPPTYSANLCTESDAETGVQVFLGGSTTQGSVGLGFTTPSHSHSGPNEKCVATEERIQAGHDDANKYGANQNTKTNVFVAIIDKPTTSCEKENSLAVSTDPEILNQYGAEDEAAPVKLARMNATLCNPPVFLQPQQPQVAGVKHTGHGGSLKPKCPKGTHKKLICEVNAPKP